MLLRFCPFVGIWRFYIWWCILILWHVYFGDVRLISAATVDESYICMLFEFWCEDVASISWIFMLFACIIALIEIGCYISMQHKLLFVDSIALICSSEPMLLMRHFKFLSMILHTWTNISISNWHILIPCYHQNSKDNVKHIWDPTCIIFDQ